MDTLQSYRQVSFVDPFDRSIVDMAELEELVPPHVTGPTYRWADDAAAQRLRHYLGLRAHIWVVDRWSNIRKAPVAAGLHFPTVFSLDGLLYIVQDSAGVGGDTVWQFRAAPIATKVDGVVLANHDPITLSGRGIVGHRYGFVERLRDKAIRENPGLSFTLAAARGVDLSSVRVIDHVRAGRLRGATLFDTGEGTPRHVAHADGRSCTFGGADGEQTAKGALLRGR